MTQRGKDAVLEWLGIVLLSLIATFFAAVVLLRLAFVPAVLILLCVLVFGCASSAPDSAAAAHIAVLDAGRVLDGAHKYLLTYECPSMPAVCEAEYDRLYADFERASRRLR